MRNEPRAFDEANKQLMNCGMYAMPVNFLFHQDEQLGASPDGLVYDASVFPPRIVGVLEIKCPAKRQITDQIPDTVKVQLYMEAAGIYPIVPKPRMFFFDWSPSRTLLKELEWKVDTWRALRKKIQEFIDGFKEKGELAFKSGERRTAWSDFDQ
jgi:hypothetical protein